MCKSFRTGKETRRVLNIICKLQDNLPELLHKVKFSTFSELHLVFVDVEPDVRFQHLP